MGKTGRLLLICCVSATYVAGGPNATAHEIRCAPPVAGNPASVALYESCQAEAAAHAALHSLCHDNASATACIRGVIGGGPKTLF